MLMVLEVLTRRPCRDRMKKPTYLLKLSIANSVTGEKPCFWVDFWLFFRKNKLMGRKKNDHGRGSALADGPGPSGLRIKGRLWLEKDGDTFLSWGRVVLLERIQELGSIAAAARSMDMAYSHAWTLVAEINRLAGEELVARTFGGRHGGRAWLTPGGEEAVAQFWGLVDNFREWLRAQKA